MLLGELIDRLKFLDPDLEVRIECEVVIDGDEDTLNARLEGVVCRDRYVVLLGDGVSDEDRRALDLFDDARMFEERA